MDRLIISELNNSTIRKTEDGRFSVLDLIKVAGEKKGQSEVYKRLCSKYPEILTICDSVRIGTGRASKLTPVANLEGCLRILGLLPGAMGKAYREAAANLVRRYLEGDADLGAELIVRDHNKDRQQKAMKRVKVTLSNKEINELSHRHNRPYHRLHDDRNTGLYGMTTKQLRVNGSVLDNETPLNYLSSRDISYADSANAMVIDADNPDLMRMAAEGIAEVHARVTGQRLAPSWDKERLTPSKARKITHSVNYQGELPV